MSASAVRRSIAVTFAGLLAALVVPITVATPAHAAAVPTLWTQVQPLPAIAGSGPGDASATDVACPAVGACSAVGAVSLPDGGRGVSVLSSTGGAWATGQVLTFAPGVASVPNDAEGRSIACASPGNCAVVGSFVDTRGGSQAFVATQSGGVWGRATPVRFASGAQRALPLAAAVSVACPAPGACTAAGSYQDAAGATRAFTVSSVGGTWGTARAATFPAGSEATPRAEYAADVACLSAARCTVIGTFTDSSDRRQGFWSKLDGSAWTTAQTVTFAPGSTDSDPLVTFESLFSLGNGHHIDCSATGRCSAVGTFFDSAGRVQIFAVPLDGTGSGQAVLLSSALPVPAENIRLSSAVSCTGVDECTMVGIQLGMSSSGLTFRVIGATSSGGTWSPAAILPLDHEVTTTGPIQISVGFDVSCPAVGECSAVGLFANANGGIESLVVTRSEGQWLPGRRVAGPGPADSGEQASYLTAVDCAAVASCTATGFSESSGIGVRAVAADAWPMPAAPTAVSASSNPGTRTVTVDWTAPTSPPTPDMYQVRCETPAGTDAVFAGPEASPATLTVRGGLTYHCGVRARYGTAFGGTFQGDWFEGPLAWSANVAVPVTVPDVPTDVRATAPALPSGRTTTVSFTPAPNQSGAAVSQYEARCTSGDGGTTRSTTGTASPIRVADLTVGRSYSCQARTRNSVGWSAWSAGAAIVVPAGPPTSVHATTPGSGSTTTTVTFVSPNGGPVVTDYRVTCASSNGGRTKGVVGTGTSIAVAGLTRAKAYRCTVVALDNGTAGEVSAASNSITVPAA